MAVVHFEELEGSPEESYSQEGFRATMRVMCPWGDRRALANYFLLEQPLYARRPDALIRCRSVGIAPYQGVRTDSQGGIWANYTSYEQALLTIEYSEATGEQSEGTGGEMTVEESFEPSIEFLTLNHTSFCWHATTNEEGQPAVTVEQPLIEGEAPGVLVPCADYSLTFRWARRLPTQSVSMMGCCNSKTVRCRTLGLTFPEETVLYHPPKISRSLAPGGSAAWTVAYRWSVRAQSWNKFFKPGLGWSYVYWANGDSKGEIYKPYTPADITRALPR